MRQFILKCDWITDVGSPLSRYCARYFRSAQRVAAPAARNAASAPPRVVGAERAARSVINKGGARLRARAPSRALRAQGSLTPAATAAAAAADDAAEDNNFRKRYRALGPSAVHRPAETPMSMPMDRRST